MNPPGKLSVTIFSDVNILALNIFDNFISKNYFVNIVTDDIASWKKETSNIISDNKFFIYKRNKFKDAGKISYVIFCGGFINTKSAYTDFSEVLTTSNIQLAKILAFFPLEVFDKKKVDDIKIGDNMSVLFVGDSLGPRINLKSNLLISRTLNEIVQKRQMSVGIGEMFYPVDVTELVKLITRWLFSFGPYGKTVLVLGKETSGAVFWNKNQKLVGKIKLTYDPDILVRNIPRGINVEKIDGNLDSALIETYQWLKNQQREIPRKVNNYKAIKKLKLNIPARTLVKVKFPKKLKPIILLIIAFLSFPFLVLIASLLTSFIGYREFIAGSDQNAGNTFLLARSFAVIAEKESGVLSYIPGINLIYKEVAFVADFASEMDLAASHSIPIVRNGSKLLENILSSQIYDPGSQSSNIAGGLSLLHDDLVSIKNLTDNASKNNVLLAKKVLTKIDFDKYTNMILGGQVIAGNFPDILGENGIKTYLVLFQNNMELRPTGGFIGSYGLLTLDSGRMTDLTVNDVYSADGQLNGHVEPPAPIKDYLGEANWWLRDSNWDPDFPTSAQRAEWFLNKEIGKSVDGVVAIDLSPIRDLLSQIGPVNLPDFGLTITSDNLYEKVESEVQDNTFAGTHQKASFLTALSRNLLGSLGKLNSSQKLSILRTFYNALDTRHIQVFLHDNLSQHAISAIGWDGAVVLPTCGTGCYADTVGLVEANVGVNKANYFVQRSVSLKASVDSNQINRTLTFDLKDTANPALGLAGKYKAYVRLLVPQDADILSVTKSYGQSDVAVSPEITTVKDRKEVGMLVEILAGQSSRITFSWKSNITSPISGYWLYIRKQAGIDILPINLNVTTPSLTGSTPYLYNAILTRDLISRFSFK